MNVSGIERLDAEQERLQVASQRGSDNKTCRHAADGHDERVTDRERDDIVALSAESHADADLNSLPLDGIRHDAMQADSGKQESQSPKKPESHATRRSRCRAALTCSSSGWKVNERLRSTEVSAAETLRASMAGEPDAARTLRLMSTSGSGTENCDSG